MHPRSDPSEELLDLAQAQDGVVTAGQADQLGLGRHARARLIRIGQWQRVDGPVLAVHPFPLPWTAQAWAGVLLAGNNARLAGAAAAHLHGLTETAPERIDVLGASPVSDRPPWYFHRERVGVRDTRSPGEPPRTTLEDTVLDLCEGADVTQVLDWLTTAVQSQRTTPARIRRALERRRRYAGRTLLLELLGDVRQGAHSPLELRYLRDVERAHGLPEGVRQHTSRHRHQRDVYYERYRLVVELDGRLGHEGTGRFRDMERDNHATVDGQASLRYGNADVAGLPCAVAWQVGPVLMSPC